MIPMSMIEDFPQWNGAGVLPPVKPGELGNSSKRSPYTTSLTGFIERFATSQQRINILRGFLEFRAQLHAIGIVSGFQWLDGSFLENIEDLEGRTPNDMDVVTFFELPTGELQQQVLQKNIQIFDPVYDKKTYKVDAYFAPLKRELDEKSVRQIAYWYSMWSHRRNGVWKGFLQVDLEPSQDAAALPLLATKSEA